MADGRAIEFREKGKVLLDIPVLWSGWELDNHAWVIEYEGEIKLVSTNHGGLYFRDAEFLRERIDDYEAALKASRKALKMFTTPSRDADPTDPPAHRES